MTEPDPPTPGTSPATAAQRPVTRRPDDRTARTLAVLALAVTAVVAWIAIDARLAVRSIEATAGGRLAELGSESQSAKATLKDSQARIAELETRSADTQEQRVALEEMDRELSRSADDRLLSEVEQLLVLASQQLQLAGNVRGALVALQAADQRLARAEKLAATPLRRAITQDMDRLKAVPQVDTVGLAVKSDGLIAQTDSLPLIIAETLPAVRVAKMRTDDQGLTRVARDFWEEMKGLVRIRDLEMPESALLTPAQVHYGLAKEILARRQATLDAAFAENPRRFGGRRPSAGKLPEQVWINAPAVAVVDRDDSLAA